MSNDANREQLAPVQPPAQTDPAQPLTPSPDVDATDDDYLYRLMREDDDAPTLAPPPLGAGRSVIPIAAPSAATTPRGRVLRRDISPTLERREVLQGDRPGDRYVRVKHAGAGFFRKQAD